MRYASGTPLLLLLISGCVGADATPVCRAHRTADLHSALRETSGLVASRAHPGVFWTHNDSGGEPVLFAIDSAGRLLGAVRVSGAENRDWEDLALARCGDGDCLYIADTGDNDEKRRDIALYRVREPAPTAERTASAERISLRYPSGPRDVEAVFATDEGSIWLVTKGRAGPIEVYRVGAEGGRAEAVHALSRAAAALPDQVTGADAAGDLVVIRTYSRLQFYRLTDGQLIAVRGGGVDLTPLAEPQGEAVAIDASGTIWLTSEGGVGGVPARLSRLDCLPPPA